MLYGIIILILIYQLFINQSIYNLTLFLLIIGILSIDLFLSYNYFIAWIYIIIYGSALVILFTYLLMINFKYKSYNNLFKFKLFNFNPLFLLIILTLFILYKPLYISSFFLPLFNGLINNNIYIYYEECYKTINLMFYLFYIKPLYLILLFLQLLNIFIILIL